MSHDPGPDKLRWDPSLTTARTGRRIYRDPLRLALVGGAAVLIVGAMLPWAQGRIGFLPVAFGGMDGAADGLILATFGLIVLFIARDPEFLAADDGGRRWAPLLIGLLCIGIWLLGRQRAEQEIRGWEEDSGTGAIVGGFWLAGVGVAAVAIAGAYASLRRRPGETWAWRTFLRAPRRSDLGSIGAFVGGFAGAIAAGVGALQLFPPAAVGAPILFFAGIGFVIGAYAGRRVFVGLGRLIG